MYTMDTFPTNEILSQFKLFWQYPVITEKTFYEQCKGDRKYMGFPWATVIDKRYNINIIYKILKPHVKPGVQYYTCCQHISFRNLIPLFKELGIYTVYTPHKILSENKLSDIQLRPSPLYAVNVEDNDRNTLFTDANVDFVNRERKYLYSFQGAYHPSWYLTDIRKRIFEMKHPDNCYINHIGNWHFDKIVYSNMQNKDNELNENDSDNERTRKYNQLLLDSKYSLCPSGSGPNSIRFWECLAIGTIPVLLADTLELPPHELWDDTIVRIPENKLEELPAILSTINETKEKEMRENCMKMYEYYKNNYCNKKTKNMVVFSNCHGEKYIDIFKRDTNIHTMFNINYIVSYQQLNNFSAFKHDFIEADVLIINNVKQYNDYTLTSLKQILKPSCLIIVIPFVRFGGYWLPEQHKRLKYVKDNAVSFFPNIEINNINQYLNMQINPQQLMSHFNQCLQKLKGIESESDILFYDFFIENHTKYPFFRDNHHPTMNMLEYVARQIIQKIQVSFDIIYNQSNFQLKQEILEYGHYKPIQNNIKNILKIEYDLDKVFICNRNEYLHTVLNNEIKHQPIIDLDDMRNKYFKK